MSKHDENTTPEYSWTCSDESAQDHASERIADNSTRIDDELYKALIEQLDRKDEQIVNLQKIIYNKDTKLLEYSQKKFWWQFWK